MFPRTITGRTFCIFFAMFGIAITGVVVVKIGAALAGLIEKTDAFLETLIKLWNIEDAKSKVVTRVTQLVITLFMAIIITWIIPALVLVKMENWDFHKATYFCFITVTTIGLGDVVPGKRDPFEPRSSTTASVYQVRYLCIFNDARKLKPANYFS